MVYDFAIIGGGILGLSTAVAISARCPAARVVVLEKEPAWAFHQTGRNSGVIHSGIYYTPGSLKANMAVSGNRSMIEFCQQHSIPHSVCGKLIVATSVRQMPALEKLYERGLANGVPLSRLTATELKEIEPNVNGVAAIHVKSTGIVDYRKVTATLVGLLSKAGADLRLNTAAEGAEHAPDGVEIRTGAGAIRTRLAINCAGLQSDRVARGSGASLRARIVPFRGEYYSLRSERRHLVKHLIYPVPNPDFPFLGVHFTRMIDGEVHAGPNAVLALKREGYRKLDISFRDVLDTLTYAGFWRMAARNWREGMHELYRSCSKAAFTRALQELIPEVKADDLIPSPPGVRAQAVAFDGKMVDDFLIVRDRGFVHVCNAPSPAATASLEIGRHIASLALEG